MKYFKFTLVLFILPFFIAVENVKAQTVTPEPTLEPTPTITVTVAPTSVPLPTAVIPGVPQGLSATVINDDRIDISWNRSANATAYELFRNNEMVAVVSSLFYSDNGLEPETSYSYKVRAYDGSNYSGFSTTVSATTKSETDELLNPTIPEGPEIDEKTPSVIEKFGFVTIGSESHGYGEIPKFDAGQDFAINGRTESYADIEVIVKSDPKSYFAKADEDGFWIVKVDTRLLEPGMHSFLIKISADEFPEIYESDEYPFEISEKPVEETVTEDNSFSNRVRFIAIGLIIFVIVIFVVGVIFAKKKGLFKKLSGDSKKDSGEALGAPPQATFSEDMIQIDDESSSKSETPQREIEDVEASADPVNSVNPGTEVTQLEEENLINKPIEPTNVDTAQQNQSLESTTDLVNEVGTGLGDTQVLADNEENKLGASILEEPSLVEGTEMDKNLNDEGIAHSVEEIDTDGVSVEVEDLGVNPYADVVRNSYAQEMPDEENLPVMDLSTGETSVENAFAGAETVSNNENSPQDTNIEQSRTIEDFSSTTPVLDHSSGDNTLEDNMVSNVSSIPETSIEELDSAVEAKNDTDDSNPGTSV